MASTQGVFAENLHRNIERSTNPGDSCLPYKMADKFPRPFPKRDFASELASLARKVQPLEQSVHHIRASIGFLETQFKASQEIKQQEHRKFYKFLVQQNNEIQRGKITVGSLENFVRGWSQQPMVDRHARIEGRVERVENVLCSHRQQFGHFTKLLRNSFENINPTTGREQSTHTICNSHNASGQGALPKKSPPTRVTKANPWMGKMLRSRKVCFELLESVRERLSGPE